MIDTGYTSELVGAFESEDAIKNFILKGPEERKHHNIKVQVDHSLIVRYEVIGAVDAYDFRREISACVN